MIPRDLFGVLPEEEGDVVGGDLGQDGEEEVVIDEFGVGVDGEVVAAGVWVEGEGAAVVDVDGAGGEVLGVEGHG